MEKIQQLKKALPTIQESVPGLTKKTADEMAGPCPWCGGNDRFTVFTEKNRFLCRGCDKSGDVIDFWKDKDNLDLAGLVKKYLPREASSNQEPIIDYLCGERAISKATVEKARQGKQVYYLPAFGNDKKPVIGARYTDLDGKTVTDQFIILDGSGKRFKKGKPAGGFFLAGKSIQTAPYIFLTEAVINALSGADVMPDACWVAIGGTPFTKKTVQLAAYQDKIISFFDNDKAGRDAAEKIQSILPGSRTVIWNGQPKKCDVNDLLKTGQVAVIRKMIEAAQVSKTLKPDATEDLKKTVSKILDSSQPCGDFDISTLPVLLNNAVEELCKTTDAAPVMILQSLLCTIAGVANNRLTLDGYFQKLHPVLWACCIAKSGDFKTTALNKGSRIASKKRQEINTAIAGVMASLEAGDIDKDTAAREIKNLELGNSILPIRASAEGFLQHLGDGHRGQIIASELGAWLKGLNHGPAGNLKETLTDLYDCPDEYVYKTRTVQSIVIRDPFISINGVSTVDWIQDNINTSDLSSGFLARFLLFQPPHYEKIPPALPQVVQYDDWAEGQIQAILDALEPKTYTLSQASQDRFSSIHTELYHNFYQLSEHAQQTLEPFIKRWSPYILKISMIMQLMEDPAENVIGTKALESARYVVDYAIKSTTHLFQNELGESPQQMKQRKVLEYIARKGGVVTKSALLTSRVLSGGAMEFNGVLDTLVEQERIEAESFQMNKGKAGIRYRVIN